jgi:hypothetical protein
VTPIKAVAVAVAVASAASWLVVAEDPGQSNRAYAMAGLLPSDISSTSTSTATATPTATATTTAPRPCNVVPHSFRPRTITMRGITKRAKVVTPPRVSRRVPGAPPLTAAGKEQFAYDLKQGIEPGDPHGHVLLNAHVWPDGSAVGNRMLAKLHKGDRVVVFGKHLHLCYRVVKRVTVLASVGLPGYYTKQGPPRLAFVTCSGKRLGPGRWTKRTVWYAAPRV